MAATFSLSRDAWRLLARLAFAITALALLGACAQMQAY
jgi:hypothetical protein